MIVCSEEVPRSIGVTTRKFTLTVEFEEDIIDEFGCGDGFALKDVAVGAEMPGEGGQARIDAGEKHPERGLIFCVARLQKIGGEEFVDVAVEVGFDTWDGHVRSISMSFVLFA
jgi:hypothetical protein